MRSRTLRHRVTTSPYLLPSAVVITALVWVLPDSGNLSLWGGLGITLATAYLLVELNNRYQLLRVRSRMVSVSFLALAAACAFQHEASWPLVAAAAVAGCYLLLFATYQEHRPEVWVFHAFLCLSLGSLTFFPLLALVPVLYFEMLVLLRSLTWRTLAASLIGVLLPYWFLAARAIWLNQLDTAFLPLLDYDFHLEAACPPLWQVANYGVVLFLALLGVLHYYRTNFNDKIRVRMYFYMLLIQEILLLAATAAWPRHFSFLFPLLLVHTAPLTAHYFTLARGRWPMTLWFLVCAALIVALGAYNYGLLPVPPQWQPAPMPS